MSLSLVFITLLICFTLLFMLVYKSYHDTIKLLNLYHSRNMKMLNRINILVMELESNSVLRDGELLKGETVKVGDVDVAIRELEND